MSHRTRRTAATRRAAREPARDLRPQVYGNGSPSKVVDPIVEPLWVGRPGPRRRRRGDGRPSLDRRGRRTVVGFDEIVDAARRRRPGRPALIVDGFLTKQATHDRRSDRRARPGRTRRRRWARSSGSAAIARSTPSSCARTRSQARDLRADDDDRLRRHRPALARRQVAARRPAPRAPAAPRVASSSNRTSSGSGRSSGRRSTSWVGSWRAQGFAGLTFKAANSRYRPGETDDGLGRSAGCRAAERREAGTPARDGTVGRARNRTDAGHPRRDRAARPGRHHGRHPELQERRDDRLRRARRAGRARPVLPGPPPGRRQLGRRVARRHRPRRRRDRAARLHRADPPRPADQQARAGQPDLPRDRRGRRQGRGAADDLRDRRRARGPGAGRRRLGPALDRARVDRAAGRADPQGRLRLRGAALRPLQVRRHDHQHRHLPADPGALRPPHPPADRRRLRGVGRPRPALPRARRLDARRQPVRHRHLDDDVGDHRRVRGLPDAARGQDPRPEGPGLRPRADVPPGRRHDPAAGQPLPRPLAADHAAATTSRPTASSGSSSRRRSR